MVLTLVFSVTVLMPATAWVIHRTLERPLGKWLRNVMHRGIDDVCQHEVPGRWTCGTNALRESISAGGREGHDPGARHCHSNPDSLAGQS